MCLADFNEVLCPSEKHGGGAANLNNIDVFRRTVEKCNLEDARYEDYCCTWSNKRNVPEIGEERLD